MHSRSYLVSTRHMGTRKRFLTIKKISPIIPEQCRQHLLPNKKQWDNIFQNSYETPCFFIILSLWLLILFWPLNIPMLFIYNSLMSHTCLHSLQPISINYQTFFSFTGTTIT